MEVDGKRGEAAVSPGAEGKASNAKEALETDATDMV
jgi:hypothetical protein